MNNKKCTWSQHPKWFLERRADPANKDLTDLEISQQYTAENMTVVEDKPSYKGVYPDKIFVECWDRAMGDKATIEEKPNNNIRPSNFIVKVDDKYCEWEFGFSIGAPSSIESLIVAIESAFSTERNYQKITRHAR